MDAKELAEIIDKFEWDTEKLEVVMGWRCPCCGRGLAPHVSECSCKKAVRSGVLEDSLAWIYEDFPPPEA